MITQTEVKTIDEDITKYSGDHQPVMLNEVIESLNPQTSGIYVDCTIGLGGHSQSIVELIGPHGRIVGIDRDASSLKEVKKNLKLYESQICFIQEDFRNVKNILEELNISKVDGILFDLGISSFQLDDPERGFSIRSEGPLDMRMDQNGHISAFDLVNSLSEKEIVTILKDFGEERFAQRIAHALVLQRRRQPIETTKDLRKAVLKAMPLTKKKQRIHPATRTFQAFRIAVNRELESLSLALDQCIGLLKPKGRLAVISFHSLEDRIVKLKFKEWSKSEKIKVVSKKPLRPSEEEIHENYRARSARLRVAERI